MIPETIPPDLQQFVQQELASGRFGNVQEMIAEGLRLLREQKLHQLRLDVSAGLEQLDQGESVELEDEKAIERFFDDIKARGRERLGTQ